jgi:ATP adenylyltransferase
MNLYYLENARSEKQYEEMIILESENKCLFCPGVLRKDTGNRILHETAYWMVTPNEYPYDGALTHLLLIPKPHVEDILDLSDVAFANLKRAMSWARSNFQMTYWGLASRNGDPAFTGGTVRHVHLHMLVGDPDKAETTPLRVKLSSSPPK